jgi:hypothetical protein
MSIEPTERGIAQLLDRLVSGDVDEAGRAQVLTWLEADPRRWRLCGVAFLEAQAWAQTFGEPVSSTAAPARPARQAAAPVGRRAVLTLTAVCVCAAFALGFLARDAWRSKAPSGLAEVESKNAPSSTPGEKPVMASVDVRTGGRRAASIQIPVVPAKHRADATQQAKEIPEYVRQQWERKGFKVSVERRFMLARLPDGQQVAVPVDQVRLNPMPVVVN